VTVQPPTNLQTCLAYLAISVAALTIAGLMYLRQRTRLRTTVTGTYASGARPDPVVALIVLTYNPAEPYAVRFCATAGPRTRAYVFARDLIGQALATGTAGEGRVRVTIERTALRVSIDPDKPYLTQEVYLLPLPAARKAAARWERVVPAGTETNRLAVSLDDDLTRLLHVAAR
jgi:hypothetical protein